MAQIVFSSLLLITANSKQLEVKIQSLAFFMQTTNALVSLKLPTV